MRQSPIAVLPREIPYFRFPLVDGAENPDWLMKAAIRVIREMLVADVLTLVACSAGMSRSPAIVAGALAQFTGRNPDECLSLCVQNAAADVSPGLWDQVRRIITQDS